MSMSFVLTWFDAFYAAIGLLLYLVGVRRGVKQGWKESAEEDIRQRLRAVEIKVEASE